MTLYTRPVCRGSWATGDNCRACPKCIETAPNSQDARDAIADRAVVDRYLSSTDQHRSD